MVIPSPLSRHFSVDGNDIILQYTCNCGKVIIDISLPASTNLQKNVWNCHCETCRRYHTAAYASYINVSEDQINIHQGQKDIGKFVSSCQSIEGAADDNIERWYCTKCSSKLLSKDKYNNCYWVNLGSIKEDTIPKSNANRWKEQLQQIENNIRTDSSCKWLNALPDNTVTTSKRDKPPEETRWTGGCICGKCQYEISITRLTQLQHCYCNLCRQLGGSFMTWFPIDKNNFAWKQQSTEAVNLVRTTPFGSRHICKHCRGVMTIVYDSQPDLIWPCAGSLDDVSLPKSTEETGSYLNRVCHICCRDKPSWLQLPDDGMERLDNAC